MSYTVDPQLPCPHCGGYHTGQCSMVKAVEYYPDGTIKRVEYHDVVVPQQVRDWTPDMIKSFNQ